MHILMLETHRGSEDGFVVRCFETGMFYEVADALARTFISRGWAAESEYFSLPPPLVGEGWGGGDLATSSTIESVERFPPP